MSNEAAERLRRWLATDGRFVDSPMLPKLVDEALAAERRATVERIRERLFLNKGEEIPEEQFTRVLDEEAAR